MEASEAIYESCFTRSIWANQPADLSCLDVYRYILERYNAAKTHG
jgi:hypothetical protein